MRITAVDTQGKEAGDYEKVRHPEPAASDATLTFAAGRLTFQRTHYSRPVSASVTPSLGTNAHDAPPVEWILITTEPIASRTDIEQTLAPVVSAQDIGPLVLGCPSESGAASVDA